MTQPDQELLDTITAKHAEATRDTELAYRHPTRGHIPSMDFGRLMRIE